MEASFGRIIWITGLSGAGKTTLARALMPHLPEPRLLLDGDELRAALAPLAGGYALEDRKKLAFTYSRLCKLAADQGICVACATISLFHEVHAWNRANLPGYFEVYLQAPEELRLSRDYKKVYAGGKACSVETPLVVGQDLEPELPLHPDLVLAQDGRSARELASLLHARLEAQ